MIDGEIMELLLFLFYPGQFEFAGFFFNIFSPSSFFPEVTDPPLFLPKKGMLLSFFPSFILLSDAPAIPSHPPLPLSSYVTCLQI